MAELCFLCHSIQWKQMGVKLMIHFNELVG